MTTQLTETGKGKGKELAAAQKAGEDDSLRGLLGKADVKARLREVLGKEAGVFASSVLSVVNGNKDLRECSPSSILNAAFQAAALKLPITPGLGQAGIVPYTNNKKMADGTWKKTKEAQFQIMARGYVQLAHRTGKYRHMNVAPVYEGQLVEYDEHRGTVKLNAAGKKSDKVIGWYAFFELLTGAMQESYWTVEAIERHAKRFSKAYQKGFGPWADKEMRPAMEAKTVIKNLLAKWGPLSTEMQTAIAIDQTVINDDGTADYIDSEAEATESEVIPDPEPAKTEAAAQTTAPEKTAHKVENVTKNKKTGEFHVLISGKDFTATEAMAKAAAKFKESGVAVEYDANESGILVELQEAQPS